MVSGRIGIRAAAGVAAALAVSLAGIAGASGPKPNDLEIIVPPSPVYPASAAETGLVGHCELKFDMTDYVRMQIDGLACSAPDFCSPALLAASRAEFLVNDRPDTDRPGKRDNIVLPILFAQSDDQVETIRGLPVEACPGIGR